MNLYKTPYSSKGMPIPQMSRRMEFFLHYWQYIFQAYGLKFDINLFKSHRTVITKIRLQVNGNYKDSYYNIKRFYLDEELFGATNGLMIHIQSLRIELAFENLHGYLSRSNYRNDLTLVPLINKELDKIDVWINKNYAVFLAKRLQGLISKNEPVNDTFIKEVKQLANCLVVELLEKGFNDRTITDIPARLFDPKRLPLKKTLSDFKSRKKFEEYRKELFKKFDLKLQLQGLVNMVSRKPRTFYVIFRVHHVKFNHKPIKILDAEIYNPLTHPKTKSTVKTLAKEDFAFESSPDETRSACNIIVAVQGTENDSVIFNAYNIALRSLNVFNERLKVLGEINLKSAIITENKFKRMYGSTSASESRTKEINEIEADTLRFFKFLNRLPNENKDDLDLITFYSRFSKIIQTKNIPLQLEELWYSLEATFGGKDDIVKLFKNVYRIYLEKKIHVDLRLFLFENLENSMGINPANKYYFLTDEELKQFGIFIVSGKTRLYSHKKFGKNILKLSTHIDCVFVNNFIAQHLMYFNDKINYYKNLDKWVEYNISELYAERNLKSHKYMSDNFFYFKRVEIVSMIFILLRVFLTEYKKSPIPNRTIKGIALSINTKGEGLNP